MNQQLTELNRTYPRFWKQERQSQRVINWLHKEAERRGVPAFKIYPQLDGDRSITAGPVRRLPELNERKKFLKDHVIVKFFEDVIANPNANHNCSLSNYTISISYSPNAQGPYSSSGGLVQEAPKVVKEHAVYRVLREKARQHNVAGPLVICIGSDQSPALSSLTGPGQPKITDAVSAAFYEHRSISAAIVISVEASFPIFGRLQRQARGQLFLNPDAKVPLTQKEAQLLSEINLNRWDYTFALQKWEDKNNKGYRRVKGSLTCKQSGEGVEIEVPANVVVDALAGKTTLTKEYEMDGTDRISQALKDGWVIESCSLKEGNIEKGEDRKVVFKLVPPSLPVFWPKR